MKKAIVVICVIMLVFLLGCSKKDMFETQPPEENSTFLSVTTEVMQTDQDGTENLIIPAPIEPPVRTLRATIPENGSH